MFALKFRFKDGTMFTDIQLSLSQSVHLLVVGREVCGHAHIFCIKFCYFVFACNACRNLLLEEVTTLCCIVVISLYGYYSAKCSTCKLYFLEEKLGSPEGVQIGGSKFLTDLFTRLNALPMDIKKLHCNSFRVSLPDRFKF